ncbi:hypothetical protein HDV64DRAFT_265577 [Trichoderma sp. TUCIM 5745]
MLRAMGMCVVYFYPAMAVVVKDATLPLLTSGAKAALKSSRHTRQSFLHFPLPILALLPNTCFSVALSSRYWKLS